MNRRDLDELVSVSEWPCFSLLVPVERRAPESQMNATRLKSARKRLLEKLEAERVEHADAAPVLAQLDALVHGLDFLAIRADGLALYASPTYAARLLLDFPVRERAVVDRVFATRDLVVALGLGVRWRALVLGTGLAHIRILEGFRDRLREVALAPLGAEPLPLVLVGLDADLNAFEKRSGKRDDVIALVRGRYERESPQDLGRILWPVVSAELTRRREERFHREFDTAVKRGHVVSGLEDVWLAAHQGRGQLLFVEENLHFPIEPGVGQRALLRAPAGLEVENAIDEIVDVVLSMGGEVQYMPAASLREHQGVVLVTRYAAVKEVA